MRQAVTAYGTAMSADEEMRWLWLVCNVAAHTWDDEHWEALSDRYIQLARQAGALSELPLALGARAYMLLFSGELAAVASLTDEIQAVTEATGSNLAPYAALGLAAFRGGQAEASALIETATRDVIRRGEGVGIASIELENAVLHNGLGRYREAMTAAQKVLEYPWDPCAPVWVLAELVEAAVRSGEDDVAAGALARLAETTSATGTDWGLGVGARCRALVSEGEDAERLYRESIVRLGRTRMRADLARAHLLYGEWLRRERRRAEAREELRTAHAMLDAMGMEAPGEPGGSCRPQGRPSAGVPTCPVTRS